MIGTNDHWAIKCYYSQFCATSKEIRERKFSGSHLSLWSLPNHWCYKMINTCTSRHPRRLSTIQGKLIPVTRMTRLNTRSSRCGSGDIPHTLVSLSPAHHPLGKYQKSFQEHYFSIKWIAQSPLTNSRSQKFYKIGI